MKDHLCLFFCDYLQQEVEYLLEQENCKDISLVFYRNNCDHFFESTELFNSLIKQSVNNSVTLFASTCLTPLVKKLDAENINVEFLEDCLQLLLPERLIQELIDEGAHIFTSGMLQQWDSINNSWGFSDDQHLSFFKESTTKLVLITHPDIVADKTTMATIAEQLDLPWETLDVSLMCLSEQLFKVIGRWRAEVTVDKKRQLADYAMVNDLIGQVASLKEESQVIKQVLELFHMFCEPSSASYLAIENGVAGKLELTIPILDKDVERKKLFSIDHPYTLDKVNNGFQLLIERGGEKIGVFGIYQVAFPQYLNHYLNLARNISPVIALSIGNARVYQQQLQAEIDIRHLNNQLGEQLEKVNHLNKELESFTYSVSHDLRSPLSMITRFLNILQRDYSTKIDERGLNLIDRVVSHSGRMFELIDDLLRLSRLTRVQLKLETVNISNIAMELIQNLQQAEPSRQIEINIADNLIVEADNSLLTVVLENLIGNAWKYTSHKALARIEIDKEEQQGEIIFRVKDNGAGFDMQQVEQLFVPFRRLHSDSDFPGSGIGLATVQRIIQRHGGKIWADSQIDKGACFYFSFA